MKQKKQERDENKRRRDKKTKKNRHTMMKKTKINRQITQEVKSLFCLFCTTKKQLLFWNTRANASSSSFSFLSTFIFEEQLCLLLCIWKQEE